MPRTKKSHLRTLAQQEALTGSSFLLKISALLSADPVDRLIWKDEPVALEHLFTVRIDRVPLSPATFFGWNGKPRPGSIGASLPSSDARAEDEDLRTAVAFSFCSRHDSAAAHGHISRKSSVCVQTAQFVLGSEASARVLLAAHLKALVARAGGDDTVYLDLIYPQRTRHWVPDYPSMDLAYRAAALLACLEEGHSLEQIATDLDYFLYFGDLYGPTPISLPPIGSMLTETPRHGGFGVDRVRLMVAEGYEVSINNYAAVSPSLGPYRSINSERSKKCRPLAARHLHCRMDCRDPISGDRFAVETFPLVADADGTHQGRNLSYGVGIDKAHQALDAVRMTTDLRIAELSAALEPTAAPEPSVVPHSVAAVA